MNITKERARAKAIIAEYERVCDTLEDGMTYGQYAELNGAPDVIVIMDAEKQLEFLDKVEKMEKGEIERITAIPIYQKDMREVKDIKDKYGLTWSQIEQLRGGLIPSQGEQLLEALKNAGHTQASYCRLKGIPLRTMQHWVHEDTLMPDWLLGFILKDLREIAAKNNFTEPVDKGGALW